MYVNSLGAAGNNLFPFENQSVCPFYEPSTMAKSCSNFSLGSTYEEEPMKEHRRTSASFGLAATTDGELAQSISSSFKLRVLLCGAKTKERKGSSATERGNQGVFQRRGTEIEAHQGTYWVVR